MFNYQDIGAFLLRIAVFMLLFATYPLLTFFLNGMLMRIFFKDSEPNRFVALITTVLITFIPFLFALFYPNIGTVLSYVGAIAGFFIIYVLPVLVYLKHKRTKLTNPLLAEAISLNEFTRTKQTEMDKSPKIALSDNFLNR